MPNRIRLVLCNTKARKDLLGGVEQSGALFLEIDAAQTLFEGLDLRVTAQDPGVFQNLIGYLERREIQPVVSRRYALCDIVAAQKEFLSKRQVGKIILLPPAAPFDRPAFDSGRAGTDSGRG